MTTKLRTSLCILLISAVTVECTFAAPRLNSVVASQNYDTAYSRWPSRDTTLKSSKIEALVTFATLWNLEVTEQSTSYYLGEASIWFGGIVDNDTLVSTAYINEVGADGNEAGFTELTPPGYPEVMRAIYPGRIPGFTTRQVKLDDEPRPVNHMVLADHFRGYHQPMHISVQQRVHVRNEFPFKDICLMDVTIRNYSPKTIRDAWFGLRIDGDAGGVDDYWRGDDDLIGSLRDISTVYVMDNNGDPAGTVESPLLKTPHAVGIRPVYSSQSAADTNFNWWQNIVYLDVDDFGPRLRGTPGDPFRDYNTGTYAYPSGDVNRYYLLRHREWDFDQVKTEEVGRNSTVWNTPPYSVNLGAVSRGSDTQGLLSIGPFHLEPDSSLRIIYAIFTGDLVHTDWLNSRNIRDGFYNEFYANLQFDRLRRSADDALNLAGELTDPAMPPLDFTADSVRGDSAWLSWESAVPGGVTSYALYLRLATRQELLTPTTVLPSAANKNWQGAKRILLPTGDNETLATGLEPGRPYLAALAHVTIDSEGDKTDPIVVGIKNESLISAPPKTNEEFIQYSKNDSRITLTWQPSPDSDVSYYKIYKTDDSVLAANKFHPFWSDDSSRVPFAPTYKATTPEGEFWYYEIKAHDSVSSSMTHYVDAAPDSTAFYWISAVTKPGFESEFTSTLQAEPLPPVERDILLVYGIPLSDDDYTLNRNVRLHLEDLVGDYVFDIYDWSDTNYFDENCPDHYCVDWSDLARYRLIIFQEYPQPKMLRAAADPTHRLLTRLIESGRTIAYFGIPPGNRTVSLNTGDTMIVYDSASFEYQHMGLDSLSLQSWSVLYSSFGAIDTLAGFSGADPVLPGWPDLKLGTVSDKVRGLFKRIFVVDSVLPLVPAMYTHSGTEVLYTYRSGFPSSSRLEGLPCGVAARDDGNPIYVFTFPLWSLDVESGQALVDHLMGGTQQQPSPPTSPTGGSPAQYSLHHNYPNPFNSSTVISFELIKARRVSLDVFNVLGARVRTLINEQSLPPGVHSVTWDGVNDDDQPVASGVYFYRLHTDAGDVARRLTLIK